MPTYTLEIDGKQHKVESEGALSDADLQGVVGQLTAPAPLDGAKPAPAAAVPAPAASKQEMPSYNYSLLGDTMREGSRAVLQGGISIAQMLEKPISAAANAVAGRQVMSGNVMSDASAAVDKHYDAFKPSAVARVAGPTLAMLAGGGLAEGVAGAGAAGASLIERLVGSGATGAAANVALNPTKPGEDYASKKLQQAGEGAAVGAGMHGMGEAVSAGGRAAKSMMFGSPSSEQKRLFDVAKQKGFSIRPDQARQDSNQALQSGLSQSEELQNQRAANHLVTERVGAQADALTPEYFSSQAKRLGAGYDAVYAPGTKFKVDLSAIDRLRNYADYEQNIGKPFMKGRPTSVANRLVGEFDAAQAGIPKSSAKEDTVTLYRAESPTTKFEDVFNKDGLPEFASKLPGARFTSDPKYAEYFKKSYGKDAVVRSIQVPRSVAEKGRVNDYEFKIDESAPAPLPNASNTTPKLTAMKISAEDIQRLRTELQNAARNSGDKIDQAGIREVIQNIDDSVARNHPAVSAELKRLGPQYQSLMTLEDAARKGVVDAHGNVSLADLGRITRSKDSKYVRGTSSNPLQEAAQLGEVLGIRGMGQARVTRGKGLASGSEEGVPVTRADWLRKAVETAKRAPGIRGMHDEYIHDYDPKTQSQKVAPIPMSAAMSTGAVAGAGLASAAPLKSQLDRIRAAREEKRQRILQGARE